MFDGMYAAWAEALGPWTAPAAILGVIALVSGLALAAWVGRRRFNRRNFAGVEQFDSFSHAVGSQFLEGLVGMIGALMAFAGFILAFVAVFAIAYG